MNKKVVVLGGGTGLPAILNGIKYIKNIDITAIVTIADSGGSTGILSKCFNIPAVGDLRRVISALSRNREDLESTMEFRFKNTKTDLDGHSMGNLFLTSHILMKNDFSKGIEAATRALNIQGKVLPVSNQFHHLNAILQDGTIIEKEDKIGHSNQPIKKVFYKEEVEATKETIKAIEEADLIIFGIGSLYTSLIPNLIYDNIKLALKNTKAKIIYFSNLFTQHGETDNMSLSDHIKAIEEHTFKDIIDEIIYSSTKINKRIIDSYEKENQFLIKKDCLNVKESDLIEVIENDQILVRHDSNKIKKMVIKLLK